MPNRILKESICTSDTLEGLTAEAERLFYRLMVQCDDYGRFDARPAIVRARCLPLKVDDVKDAHVAGWLDELAEAGLIRIYHVEGHPYLEMVTWDKHQQRRAKVSKYPDPPVHANNGKRPLADAGNSPRIRIRIRNRIRGIEESRIETGSAAKAAEAASAAAKAEKSNGPNLALLVDAFRERSLSDPAFIGAEPKRAQALLASYGPDVIAECWSDIQNGRYGSDVDRSNLSFEYLSRNNRLGNWRAWKDSGSPPPRTNGHLRPMNSPYHGDAAERAELGGSTDVSVFDDSRYMVQPS